MDKLIQTFFWLFVFILALKVLEALIFRRKKRKSLVSPQPDWFSRLFPSADNSYPFRKKQYLMTQTERKFFGILQEVIKDKYFIMPQVALSRIIEPQNGQAKYGPNSWYSDFNRINKKTVDFVVFDKVYLSPLLVIELDDYTHNYFSRQQRDDFLDGALKAADLNILHIKPQYNYDIGQLEQAIFSQLKG